MVVVIAGIDVEVEVVVVFVGGVDVMGGDGGGVVVAVFCGLVEVFFDLPVMAPRCCLAPASRPNKEKIKSHFLTINRSRMSLRGTQIDGSQP